MNVLNWIKHNYYNYRLSCADKELKRGNIKKAESIYKDILDKHELAVLHLSNLYVNSCDSNESKIRGLKELEYLGRYVSESQMFDYQCLLDVHIANINTHADHLFINKDYTWAKKMLETLVAYKNAIYSYNDKLHRYTAYWYFSKSQEGTNRDVYLKECIAELKEILGPIKVDLEYLVQEFSVAHQFNQILKLLLPFKDENAKVEELIIDSVVKIALGYDADMKSPKQISEYCSDVKLAKSAARELALQANKLHSEEKYIEAIKYDELAAEFLSNDNSFNYSRCVHILNELKSRACADEISRLFALAKELELDEFQISNLKKDIFCLAQDITYEQSIAICRLFIGELLFDKLYITKAEALCVDNVNKINAEELKRIIIHNTDKDSLVDTLALFVNYIPKFDNEFFECAIQKIIQYKDLKLLKKYWNVKSSSIFITKLVSSECSMSNSVVDLMINNHHVFLPNKAYLKSFYTALESLNVQEYLLTSLEKLMDQKCEVDYYYISTILRICSEYRNDQSIVFVNRALQYTNNQQVINKKKELIRAFVENHNYTAAISESKSLIGVDHEAYMLLIEIYYSQFCVSTVIDQKESFLYQAFEIIEKQEGVLDFGSKKAVILNALADLSKYYFEVDLNEKAYFVCSRILTDQKAWLTLYIDLKNLELKTTNTLTQKIDLFSEAIKQIINKISSPDELTDSYYIFWDNYINLSLEKAQSQPKDKAIKRLLDLRSEIMNYCKPKAAWCKLYDKLTHQISLLIWAYGVELEEEYIYDEAIEQYRQLMIESTSCFSRQAELRRLICYIKSNVLNSNIEIQIQNALGKRTEISIGEEIAYRYALYLLQNKRVSLAKEVLTNYLPQERELLSVCENMHIKEAEEKLCDFNENLRCLHDGGMTVEVATCFINSFEEWGRSISNILKDTSVPFSSNKNEAEKYLLRILFKEEQYSLAFDKMLQLYSGFITDDEAFRNLAIASIGLIENKDANFSKVKLAISIALSAIYTDRLFVKCLEYTAWDDPFTFTLEGSLGNTSEHDYDELPDNVNFSLPIDNSNVSIKEVQFILLNRLEKAISLHYVGLESFFNSEKSSLDALIELRLDHSFILVSPYLANTSSKAWDSIKIALDYEKDQNYGNKEDVLALGGVYGLQGAEYASYKVSLAKANACCSSLNEDARSIRSAFSEIEKIKRYSNLYAKVKSTVSTAMNTSIKENPDLMVFLAKYEVICGSLKDASLSYACANYINREIVRHVNEDRMIPREGVQYLVRAFKIAPSNVQVKENLEQLLKNLVQICEEQNNAQDNSVLDQAMIDTDNLFLSQVEDTRIRAILNNVVEKVNKGSMSKAVALNKVYNLYSKKPNMDLICENLALLCNLCIRDYIVEASNASSGVIKTLDKINNNKSATFKRHAIQLADTYYAILRKMPKESRLIMLVEYQNERLTEEGLALMKGLGYYKKLGSVSQNSINKLVHELI